MRNESGTLHFYVNSVDQGEASTNVPDRVYGVIDLYGQASQATIVDSDCSPDTAHSSVSNTTWPYRYYNCKIMLLKPCYVFCYLKELNFITVIFDFIIFVGKMLEYQIMV